MCKITCRCVFVLCKRYDQKVAMWYPSFTRLFATKLNKLFLQEYFTETCSFYKCWRHGFQILISPYLFFIIITEFFYSLFIYVMYHFVFIIIFYQTENKFINSSFNNPCKQPNNLDFLAPVSDINICHILY